MDGREESQTYFIDLMILEIDWKKQQKQYQINKMNEIQNKMGCNVNKNVFQTHFERGKRNICLIKQAKSFYPSIVEFRKFEPHLNQQESFPTKRTIFSSEKQQKRYKSPNLHKIKEKKESHFRCSSLASDFQCTSLLKNNDGGSHGSYGQMIVSREQDHYWKRVRLLSIFIKQNVKKKSKKLELSKKKFNFEI